MRNELARTTTSPSEVTELPLAPWQWDTIFNPYDHFCMFAGVGCVRGSTLVETERGPVRMDQLRKGTRVWSMGDQGPLLATCEAPFVKGRERLYRVVHAGGEFVAHGRHLTLLKSGEYQYVKDLSVGDELFSFLPSLLRSTSVADLKSSPADDPRSSDIPEGFRGGCLACICSRDPRPLSGLINDPVESLKSCGEQACSHCAPLGDLENGRADTHRHQLERRPTKPGSLFLTGSERADAAGSLSISPIESTLRAGQSEPLFQNLSDCRRINLEWADDHKQGVFPYCTFSNAAILQVERLENEEEYWDVEIPGPSNYLAEGAVHHNSGKTFTGSQFAIKQMNERPHLMGLIGANTYDQLSQVTLRETLYWLDHYGFDWVIDCKPPRSWKSPRFFKKHTNILSVLIEPGVVAQCFTRVMGKGNPLRGLEFSWYWLDEVRDTPEDTHDVILSRLREDEYVKGLVTTTTNGEDWSFKRFTPKAGSKLYGSMHVRTIESVRYGIVPERFYAALLESYSPKLAAQELDAKHITVVGLQAYECFNRGWNLREQNPFAAVGERVSPYLPVDLYVDFNIQPMGWTLAQFRQGQGQYIFDEIFIEQRSNTEEAAREFVHRFKQLGIKANPAVVIIGDATGKASKTSASGATDYTILCRMLDEHKIPWANLTPDSNPPVKDRVNMVNSRLRSSTDQTTLWFHPSCKKTIRCFESTGFKKGTSAILDQDTDKTLTHLSDGVGYGVCVRQPIVLHGGAGVARVIKR